jgi:type II secretory pathway pseudopilin PulG
MNSSQSGLTLIESILAMLILAGCVFGVAALYTPQQSKAHRGYLHEQAVQLSLAIAEKIRSDSKGNYETTLGASCDSKADGSALAKNIVACWQDEIEQKLTNGSGRISLDKTTLPAQYVIVVSWSEPRTGTASYVLRVTPAATAAVATRAAG